MKKAAKRASAVSVASESTEAWLDLVTGARPFVANAGRDALPGRS